MSRLRKREMLFKRFEEQLEKVKTIQNDLKSNTGPLDKDTIKYVDDQSVCSELTESVTHDSTLMTSVSGKFTRLSSLEEDM